jgi:hypothetical protein
VTTIRLLDNADVAAAVEEDRHRAVGGLHAAATLADLLDERACTRRGREGGVGRRRVRRRRPISTLAISLESVVQAPVADAVAEPGKRPETRVRDHVTAGCRTIREVR